MGSSSTRLPEAFSRALTVLLEDGRELSVPLSWFPRLDRADEEALQRWSLIGPGVGIHWPEIDEHVSVHSLLYPGDTVPSREVRERRDPGELEG